MTSYESLGWESAYGKHRASGPADASPSPVKQDTQAAPAAPAEPAQRSATPAVKRMAEDNGINLAEITGTGAGGRITVSDVREAAALKNPPAPVSEGAKFTSSASSYPTPVDENGPYARNPLVSEFRRSDPEGYQWAIGLDPNPPTLFPSGDLPIFIASGVDPQMLMKLPWVVRPAAAAADSVELARLLAEYGPGNDPLVAGMDFGGHQLVSEYHGRFMRWASGQTEAAANARVQNQLRAAIHGETARERVEGEAYYDKMFPEEAQKRAEAEHRRKQEEARAQFEAEQARRERDHTVYSRDNPFPR